MQEEGGMPPEWEDDDAITIPQELFNFGPSTYFLFFSEYGL